jgi:hypothetical protein
MSVQQTFRKALSAGGAIRSPRRVPVDELDASAVLPDWDYADAYECQWRDGREVEAMAVAEAILGPSRSAQRVLAARDLLVRPFGLRVAHQGSVLLFPVLHQSPRRVVCGLDDRHLDFRVIVTVEEHAVARCTTVVRRHGTMGAVYFAVVGPFHRRLVPRLMQRGRGRGAGTDG